MGGICQLWHAGIFGIGSTELQTHASPCATITMCNIVLGFSRSSDCNIIITTMLFSIFKCKHLLSLIQGYSVLTYESLSYLYMRCSVSILDEIKFRPVLQINESKGANYMGIVCILLLAAGLLAIVVVDRTRLLTAYSTFMANIHSIWALSWIIMKTQKITLKNYD